MTVPNSNWLSKPNLTWSLVLGAAISWSVLILVLNDHTGLGGFLQTQITSPFAFKMRTVFNASPPVDQRLRIFGVDDPTFAALGSWVLAIDEWALALESLDKKAPRAIIIDAMFSKVPDPRGRYQSSYKKIANLKTPIITGAYVAPQEITYRNSLSLTASHFKLANLVDRRSVKDQLQGRGSQGSNTHKLFPMIDRTTWFPYGPAWSFKGLFRRVGHFTYGGNGLVPAFLRLDQQTVLPHMAFLLAGQLRGWSGELYADQVKVPLTAKGLIPVNIPQPKDLFKQTFSMKQLLKDSAKGLGAKGVSKGDVVVIIPHLYTGNTDFKETPQGLLPGGFIIAALANSILTGDWLRPWPGENALILGASLIGGVVAWCCGTLSFWLWFIVFAGSLICGATGAFILGGVIVPWFMPLTAFSATALSLFAEKTRRGELKARFLRNTLAGSVAPDDLQKLMTSPAQVSFDAREQVVTLVFFDVAGFSLTAEKMMPRTTFDYLKGLLGRISQQVYDHGGIVDRTLGDGLLCYFGYAFGEAGSTPFHADQALQCAIAVQQENIALAMTAADQGQPIYPLRVGINTAPCYLGDLGFGEQIDFTVVGNGVNMAKRFEGACEPHAVLMGATTYGLLNTSAKPTTEFSKRLIRIKHHDELLVAYEYDPLAAKPTLRQQAEIAYRAWTDLKRHDQRWTLSDQSLLTVHTDAGQARLIDFSHSGFRLGLEELLTKDSTIAIDLCSFDDGLNKALIDGGLDKLTGEVRWSYNDQGQFIHGIWLRYSKPEQGAQLVELLRHHDTSSRSDLENARVS